tara:strand:- start:6277 stop:6582 length:306 start_codon:yes stop_codon:yes gene_type:complete
MSQTHASLRAQFITQAQAIASEIGPDTDHHDVAQVDRVREILLMGIRLVDEEMGTPEQIEALISQRIQEVQDEVRPFSRIHFLRVRPMTKTWMMPMSKGTS